MERRMVFENKELAGEYKEKEKIGAGKILEESNSYLLVALNKKKAQCSSAISQTADLFQIMAMIDRWMKSSAQAVAKQMYERGKE